MLPDGTANYPRDDEARTMDLHEVVGRVLVNPTELVERVLEPVRGELQRDGIVLPAGDAPPEQLLATTLGAWLAKRISSGRASQDEAPADVGDSEPTLYHELINRNQVIAAALGACPCWGQGLDCRTCKGAGTPGWRAPDPQLFIEYVHPAVQAAMANSHTETTAERL